MKKIPFLLFLECFYEGFRTVSTVVFHSHADDFFLLECQIHLKIQCAMNKKERKKFMGFEVAYVSDRIFFLLSEK